MADAVAAEFPLSEQLVRDALRECDLALQAKPVDWGRVWLLSSVGLFWTGPQANEALVPLVERILCSVRQNSAPSSIPPGIPAQISGYEAWVKEQSAPAGALAMAITVLGRQRSPRAKALLLEFARGQKGELGGVGSDDFQRNAIAPLFMGGAEEALETGRALLDELRLSPDMDIHVWGQLLFFVRSLERDQETPADLSEEDLEELRQELDVVKRERLAKRAASLGRGAESLLLALHDLNPEQVRNLSPRPQLAHHLREQVASLCRQEIAEDNPDWLAIGLLLHAGQYGGDQTELASIAAQMVSEPPADLMNADYLDTVSAALHVLAWQEHPKAVALLKQSSHWQFWNEVCPGCSYAEVIRPLMRATLDAAIGLPEDKRRDVLSHISSHWGTPGNADEDMVATADFVTETLADGISVSIK